jgi:hypothetical protein
MFLFVAHSWVLIGTAQRLRNKPPTATATRSTKGTADHVRDRDFSNPFARCDKYRYCHATRHGLEWRRFEKRNE